MRKGRPRTLPPDKRRDRRAYMKARYQNNPVAKLSTRTAHRFRDWTGESLQSRGLTVADVLGCSLQDAVDFIASQFKPGQTWDNWGRGAAKWQLDHIYALCLYDPTSNAGVKSGMHHTNLQPLWNHEHEKKSAADCAAAAIDRANKAATGAEPIPF